MTSLSGAAVIYCVELLDCSPSHRPLATPPPAPHARTLHRANVTLLSPVVQALALLNATSSAAVKGGYASWAPPLDTSSLLAVLQAVGIQAQGGTSCKQTGSTAFADAYSLITCPAGTFLKTPAEVASGCASANRTCFPASSGTVGVCICGPCAPVPPQEVTVVISVASPASPALPASAAARANGTLCAKLVVCAQVFQQDVVTVSRVLRCAARANRRHLPALPSPRALGATGLPISLRLLRSLALPPAPALAQVTVMDSYGPQLRSAVGLPLLASVSYSYGQAASSAQLLPASLLSPANGSVGATWTFALPTTRGLGYDLLSVFADRNLVASAPTVRGHRPCGVTWATRPR